MTVNNEDVTSLTDKKLKELHLASLESVRPYIGEDIYIYAQNNIITNKSVIGSYAAITNIIPPNPSETVSNLSLETASLMRPKTIKKLIDKNVVGQEQAKKKLILAAYLHFINMYNKVVDCNEQPYVTKPVTLLVGNTGTGKTFLIQELARILEIPLLHIDASAMPPKGWSGRAELDKEIEGTLKEQFSKCIHKSANTIEGLGYRLIIFVDELDKISLNLGGQHEEYHIAKQASLLRLIEGAEISPGFNTKNAMFVFAGSFQTGQKELNKHGIGFNTEFVEFKDNFDINKVGIITELAGRINSYVHLEPVSLELLTRIISEGDNCLQKQYEMLLSRKITKHEMLTIAQNASKSNRGARDLVNEFMLYFEKELMDLYFDKQEKLQERLP